MMTYTVPPPAFSATKNAIGLRSRHYREQAARFRSLANIEPLAQMKRYLTRLARQYAELATIEPRTASEGKGVKDD